MLTASLPPALEAAVRDAASRAGGAADLSARYRSGDRQGGPVAHSAADAAAYAATRLPATYAAVETVLRETAAGLPEPPRTLLDVGAGLGAALWAAAEVWPGLERATALEAERAMARLGREAAAASNAEAVVGATWLDGRAPGAIPTEPFDLVTVSYVLNELDEDARYATLARAWEATRGCLVLVEPGTPEGYLRIIEARNRLIAAGGSVVAPCPHDAECPLLGSDWCHFAVRLPRSSEHRRAKGGVLGHEDEKFSYVAIARRPGERARARVLRHPQVRGGHVGLDLCMREGIRKLVVAKRHGAHYRHARKVSWGEDFGEPPATTG